MVTNMPVTLFTIAWAILAVISMFSLYFFNHGRNLFTFITSRRFLIFFILASIFGMRQQHEIALIIVCVTFIWMTLEYISFMEKYKRLKH